MRTSLIALGLLAFGLAQCSHDRGLFVGAERDPGDGGGEPGETGGTGNGTGGSGGGSIGGSESSGGTENTGGSDRGGSGSGAEGGEPSETGGTGGSDRGGTDAGGTDAGGSAGAAGSGGMNDGGRAGSANAGAGGATDGGRAGSAGSNNAGAGGTSDVNCEALGREYSERLAAAQQCSLQLPYEQCTIEMPDDFFCPCKTFVNPMREADISRLNEILQRKTTCVRICPAIACPDLKRGVCSADGIIAPAPGRCVGAP